MSETDLASDLLEVDHNVPYLDGRPKPLRRLQVEDTGPIFEHGRGPDGCDELGAREPSVVFHEGLFHLFYDGAKSDYGWCCCLATSRNLKDWERHGPVLKLGPPGSADSACVASPWFWREGNMWHMYYLGTRFASGDKGRVPLPPYESLHATSENLSGPWQKDTLRHVIEVRPGTHYNETASPGYVIRHEGKLRMYFSSACSGSYPFGVTLRRSLGLASAESPEGPWVVEPDPILPVTEQVENSSIYYHSKSQTWYLFTNHLGIDHNDEYADAIWIYWSKNPLKWKPEDKAVVLDGEHCCWSKHCIGMPSVIPVDGRLALFYDAPGGVKKGHLGRDIGLAWIDLPMLTSTYSI